MEGLGKALHALVVAASILASWFVPPACAGEFRVTSTDGIKPIYNRQRGPQDRARSDCRPHEAGNRGFLQPARRQPHPADAVLRGARLYRRQVDRFHSRRRCAGQVPSGSAALFHGYGRHFAAVRAFARQAHSARVRQLLFRRCVPDPGRRQPAQPAVHRRRRPSSAPIHHLR